MGPMFLVKSMQNNPGFNVRMEYPNGFVVTQIIANSLFLVMTVYIIICTVLMARRWKVKPVRHKAFMIMTFSFFLIFLISMFQLIQAP